MRTLVRYAATIVVALLLVLLTAPGATAKPDPRDPGTPDPQPSTTPAPDTPEVPESKVAKLKKHKLPKIPAPSLPNVPLPSVPGISDCRESPVPVSPDQGVAGFFTSPPDELPPDEDPFKDGSKTTIYEQYGYAGLRYRTYDLGCGPDALRSPDAVIGTSVGNWIMQFPIAFAALTGSVTEVAYQPTFLGAFDPLITKISTALHESLFATWIPAVFALLGGYIIFKSRRAALSTTAAAVGWALIVTMVAVALFRWPVAAGNAADDTVTGTLGAVVGRLDGDPNGVDPGMAVSSHVHESILYRSWLAGTLGNPDSRVAQKYGPELFKAQALTWREAAEAEKDTDRAKEIIEAKQKRWEEIAEKIKNEDPEAYENLTGKRSENRVSYATLSALATLLSLPFLLLSALLMLGCYLIVRLAVMMFPAFAVLGAFPSSRGLVTGLGRTVAAAVVNAIVFGVGAGVTIAVLGILFHPGGGAPPWLSMVLMPLFSYIMWKALKPFRRLTTMVSPDTDPFHSSGRSHHRSRSKAWKLTKQGAAAFLGGAAGAAVAEAIDDDKPAAPPERAEARPTRPTPSTEPRALAAAPASIREEPTAPTEPSPDQQGDDGTPYEARRSRQPAHASLGAQPPNPSLGEGRVPQPTTTAPPPLPPTEPEWYDGEEVYPIYRPSSDGDGDAA
jgi:uncharacterized membrane protein